MVGRREFLSLRTKTVMQLGGPNITQLLASTSIAIMTCGMGTQALAQTRKAEESAHYPNKPIRIVAGYPAGGAVDIVARTIGSKLADRLGQPVIVDNRPGASGNIATDIVAKSAPDGYTLLLGTVVDSISPSLFKKLPFDFVQELAPITLAVNYPFYLVVLPAVPARSVKELVALAKARPGELNFASSGNGSSPHLAGEMLKTMAGIHIVHIPYKGASPALADMFAGQVQIAFMNAASALPFIKSGKLRALGITGAQRAPQAPELPTLIESGFPGFEIYSWFGVLTRAGTPAPIIDKLHSEIATILKQKDVRERFDAQGLDVISSTPQEFRAFIRSEMAKHAKIVKDAGVKID